MLIAVLIDTRLKVDILRLKLQRFLLRLRTLFPSVNKAGQTIRYYDAYNNIPGFGKWT